MDAEDCLGQSHVKPEINVEKVRWKLIPASDNEDLQITKSHCPRREPELWFSSP
jgi:hypothetical protein